jgi:hypothetical protein
MHYRKEHTAWQAKYDARAPKDGDPAPDFALSDVNGEHSVRLSDFHGKKLGTFGFKPGELKEAIDEYLARL